MKKALQHGFQRFCDGTSCHGFAELYHAKSLFWKISWIMICGAAIGVTTYQVYQCIKEYILQDPATMIMVADESQILYPPLSLCFWHWLYWVDFHKAMALKIDKGALLFSFNSFTRIFSNELYDVDVAEQALTNYLASHNYTSLFEFHKSIARSAPVVSNDNLSIYFKEMSVVLRDDNFLFCYTISSKQIFNYFNEHKIQAGADAKKALSFYTVNEDYDNNGNHMRDFVEYNEYNNYMIRWIMNKTKYHIFNSQIKKNFTNFSPPLSLLPNAYDWNSDVQIIPETDEYYVNFKTSVCRWKNRRENSCIQGKKVISDDESCKFDCIVKAFKQNCSCVRYPYAIYMSIDKPNMICRDEFYLLSTKTEKYLASVKTPNKTIYSQICQLTDQNMQLYHHCLNNCRMGCEVWTYDASILLTTMPSFIRTIGNKNETNIIIDYPMGTGIQIMVETDAQSWEVFIGNVGGLLGIWTGASVVSLIQFFYLCCFSNTEAFIYKLSWCPWRAKPLKKSNIVSISSVIDKNSKKIQVVDVG